MVYCLAWLQEKEQFRVKCEQLTKRNATLVERLASEEVISGHLMEQMNSVHQVMDDNKILEVGIKEVSLE